MKLVKISLLALSLMVGQVYAQNLSETQDVTSKEIIAPKGFNKIGWGKNYSSIKGLKESSEAEDALQQAEVFSDTLKCYEKEKESLNINGTKMDKIIYCFTSNKLVSGIYKFSGLKTSKKVKASLVGAYGEGLQYDTLIDEYKWDFGLDDEVFVKVHLYFDEENGALVVSNEKLKNSLKK